MEALSRYTGQVLELTQPGFFKESLELRAGETLLGRMSFPKLFVTSAEIEYQDKKWEIKRESFWKGTLGIYKYGYEMPSYTFIPRNMRLGEVQFPKGERLYIRQYFLKSAIEIMDKSEQLLARIKSKSGFKKKYLIELVKQNDLIDEHPWTLFLIAYMAVRKEKSRHSSG